ncbi:MAG: hypothetical protein AAF616_15090 [Bacteroidota bacterium]
MNLEIEKVLGEKSDELLFQIAKIWSQTGALPKHIDPIDRAKEAVLIAREEDKRIIGVTTSRIVEYAQLKNHFFMIRGFIVPQFRIPGLFMKMIKQTMCDLESYSLTLREPVKPIGILAEVENAKLKSARLTRLASGLTLQGFSSKGNPIYVYYFQGTRF